MPPGGTEETGRYGNEDDVTAGRGEEDQLLETKTDRETLLTPGSRLELCIDGFRFWTGWLELAAIGVELCTGGVDAAGVDASVDDAEIGGVPATELEDP
jgi:hypothetical protein